MKKLLLFTAIVLSGMLMQAHTTDFDITRSGFPIKDHTQRHLIPSNNDDFLPDLPDGSYFELKNLSQSINKDLKEDIYLCDSSYSFYWDEPTSSWGNNWKSIFTYDSNGNRTEKLVQDWDLVTNAWVNVYNKFYYYSIHQIFGITEFNISGISIYPNPVSQSITIENVRINATIMVYDISGRLQISEIATTEKQLVDLSKLGKEVYILSIHDDHRTVSLKFIKN